MQWAEPIEKNDECFWVSPLLDEGIMHFESEIRTVRGSFNLYFKVEDEGIYYNLLGSPLDFFHDKDGTVEVDGKEISQETYLIDISPEEALNAIYFTIEHCIKAFGYSMLYVEYVRQNPKVIEVRKERQVVRKKPKGGKGKNRKVYLSKTIYKVTYDEMVKRPEIKTYERHTEAWTVSGHPRHYKNGKVIYIKPYVKGNGEKITKTYVVTPQQPIE
jgi:hypothetical protein